MTTAIIEITAHVKFTYDENRNNLEDAAGCATDLFLNPNYHSIANGVKLQSHEIMNQEFEKL